MLLLAVTTVALNQQSGLQNRMATNQTQSIQTSLGQMAAAEEAIWQLTSDPMWWSSPASKDYTYDGALFNRTVVKSSVSNYNDAITVSVTAPGGERPFKTSYRYYVYPPIPEPLVGKPIYQVSSDISGNAYFAVPDKHRVYKRDAITGDITEVAGNGTSGYSGDGGPATQAQLNEPKGVFIDNLGSIYIADTDNHCIRKVTAGTITTVAGICGSTGYYSGDGGPATQAQLNGPEGVFIDTFGGIYIADTDNHCIRKVTAGTITPEAGICGPTGDYFGDGDLAILAKLNSPQGLFVDALGNVYIADTGNNRIRKVDGLTKFISTIAGTGTGGYDGDGGPALNAQLKEPQGVFVDQLGNIYIADTDNNKIRKVDNSSQIITTFAGTGEAGDLEDLGDGLLATEAKLDKPSGLTLVLTGIVIADTKHNTLRHVDSATGIISSLFTPAGFALEKPAGVALDTNGNLYIADANNHRIRKINVAGIITIYAGNGSGDSGGDGGPAISAQLKKPQGVSAYTDTLGNINIYIADSDNDLIRKVDSLGIISIFAGAGSGGDGGPAISAKLKNPRGVAVDNAGNVYIAETTSNKIRKVDGITNIISTVAGTGDRGASGDGGPATSARLDRPEGVFVDSAGNVYIADTTNNKIRKVDGTTNFISTVAGTGVPGYSGDGGPATSAKFKNPQGVFVDQSGNIYISDTKNNRIRVVSVHDGNIYTLAGSGTPGYNGEGLPSANTKLENPAGLVMAANRGGANIYVSDTDNNRIRILRYKKVKELY